MNRNEMHQDIHQREEPAIWRDSFALSDRGNLRGSNEDQFLIGVLRREMSIPQTSVDGLEDAVTSPTEDGVLMVVADGVSGNGEGAYASRVVVETLGEQVAEFVPWTAGTDRRQEKNFLEWMKRALLRCASKLRQAGVATENRDLATTLTVACVFWPNLYTFHLGDSRAYRLRGGKLEQLTTDHTVARKFCDRGVLNESDADFDRFDQVLWNSVHAGVETVRPEIQYHTLEPGDGVLLCTDGLYRTVDDVAIRAAVEEEDSSHDTCQRLVKEVLLAGGLDNVTIALTRFHGVDAISAGAGGGRSSSGGVELDLPVAQPRTEVSRASLARRTPNGSPSRSVAESAR